MVKTLTPVGNGLGLIIDAPILEQLGIDRGTPLEIKIQGQGILIQPVGQEHRTRVLEAAERVMEVHEETLRKLAQ